MPVELDALPPVIHVSQLRLVLRTYNDLRPALALPLIIDRVVARHAWRWRGWRWRGHRENVDISAVAVVLALYCKVRELSAIKAFFIRVQDRVAIAIAEAGDGTITDRLTAVLDSCDVDGTVLEAVVGRLPFARAE